MTAVLPSSFRDPSGFLFTSNGVLYRQVNQAYGDAYDRLMESGLYEALTSRGRLVPHDEVDVGLAAEPGAHRVLRPERIPFISYPYEWCFSELKDAALLTLDVQQEALEHGLSLKDASAFNVQFGADGRPVLIDTLSFEPYEEGRPWTAYRQFCQHFLAPLALMQHTDVRLNRLWRTYIDGIPLDLAATLLPRRALLRFSLLTHIYLHARSQQRYGEKAEAGAKAKTSARVSRQGLLALIDNLKGAVRRMRWEPEGTEWGDYYSATNYTPEARQAKLDLVGAYVDRVDPETVWDLGGNTGVYSRVASDRGARTVCFDIDPAAVEKNYRQVRESGEANLLPLLLDLSNPTPALGWAHAERLSLEERGPADLVLALALVHHLAIGNNVPLPRVASYLAALGEWLVIEFVPKGDSQVDRLLASREDIFDAYHDDGFRAAFGEHFDIVDSTPVAGSERTLYLMRRSAA